MLLKQYDFGQGIWPVFLFFIFGLWHGWQLQPECGFTCGKNKLASAITYSKGRMVAYSRINEASLKFVHLVRFPSIRPVIHPAGLIGSGFLSRTDSGDGKGVGDLPCAATRSGFCSSSSSSYIQPGFLSREQEFGEPMKTYLAHHWLVSETVVVDKKNTTVGWVLDFFVIPICSGRGDRRVK